MKGISKVPTLQFKVLKKQTRPHIVYTEIETYQFIKQLTHKVQINMGTNITEAWKCGNTSICSLHLVGLSVLGHSLV